MTFTGFRNRIEVNPPAVRQSGWLASADVRDADGYALMGAEYETDTCISDVGGEFIDKCYFEFGGMDSDGPPPTAPVRPPGVPNNPWELDEKKDFQAPLTTVSGDPFVPFAGVECDPIMMSESDYLQRSSTKFDMVESRQVDYHIARLLEHNGNNLGDCPLSQMMMNADYTALNEYGSFPLIAMSAPLMLCAAAQGLIYQDVNYHWRSVNHAFVTTIAQHDSNTTANFFLTGHVTLLRGPKESHVATDVRDNVTKAMTERIYVPLIECMAYYATATCDAPVTP